VTVWLVGLMGSGKTSAGTRAAARLGVVFQDTDAYVERTAGRNIAEIWTNEGEVGFRNREAEAIADLARTDGIVATGGGAVIYPPNRQVMTSSGSVIWLKGSPRTLACRLSDSPQRPSLPSSDEARVAFLASLGNDRERLYQDVATHQIDTEDKMINDVARAIEEIWAACISLD
jgi:shikimate kinase